MTGSETATVIQAWVATFCDLTAVGRFEVPWHQRRYDWTSENVDDLMADLDEAIAARRHCYFLAARGTRLSAA